MNDNSDTQEKRESRIILFYKVHYLCRSIVLFVSRLAFVLNVYCKLKDSHWKSKKKKYKWFANKRENEIKLHLIKWN